MPDVHPTSERESKDIAYLVHYMDLVVMYHGAGDPSELFQKFPNYAKECGIATPDISNQFREVDEGIRAVIASSENARAQGLVYLAEWLQRKDTSSSRRALFWLESALSARKITNTNPYYLKQRKESGEDIEGILAAYQQIVNLREREAA